jgi:hypothetical protein
MALLAQLGGYSLLQILLIVVVCAAAIAVVVVGLRWMGVTIPEPMVKIFWICVIAAVVVGALVFLFRLIGNMH